MTQWKFATTAVVALALGLGLSAPSSAEMKRITVGTNPQGTMYFTLGGGLSKLFSDKLGINATAQPHSGSSVYLPLVASGEVTMGFSSSLDSGLAYAGEGPYKDSGGLKNLRVIAKAWPLHYAFFARADSGMKTVADLKGKKVALDFKANVALKRANEAMLRAGGLEPSDVTSVTISGIPGGYKGVTEESFDAAATALGIGLAKKADATIPGGIIMLSVTGPNANTEFTNSQFPGLYVVTSKPSKNNAGVKTDTTVTAFDVYLLIGAEQTEDDVYTLTKTLHENWEGLQKDYGVLRRNKPEQLAATSNTVPYHPGAIKYYKEIGIWTADNDARDASLTK